VRRIICVEGERARGSGSGIHSDGSPCTHRNLREHRDQPQGQFRFSLLFLLVRPRGQVTLSLLQQARELNIPSLWLQPGAEDDAVTSYIHANGLEDKVLYGGPCILVEGDGIWRKSLL